MRQFDRRTGLADRLLAAGQSESVDGKFAADCASQFDGNVIRRKRAGYEINMLLFLDMRHYSQVIT